MINEKKEQIGAFESDIQIRQEQNVEFSQDKKKPTATQKMIKSFEILIDESVLANKDAQTKIDNLRVAIAELQQEIDGLLADGEKSPVAIPAESSSQPPTEEDNLAVEAANEQAESSSQTPTEEDILAFEAANEQANRVPSDSPLTTSPY